MLEAHDHCPLCTLQLQICMHFSTSWAEVDYSVMLKHLLPKGADFEHNPQHVPSRLSIQMWTK